MQTSEFLRHSINEGTFGRSKCQQTGSRLRELGLYPVREDLTPQTAAALLFALTFGSQSELVAAVTNRRKDFDEVTESLGRLFSSPEMLTNVENLEFYAVGMMVKFSSHSHFAGTSPKSEIYQTTFCSGDWLRLFVQAMVTDKFINESY